MRIENSYLLYGNVLSRTTSAISRSLQRLSTGRRVNSPQDDVVAFSEGVTLDSIIRGTSQAIRNISEAQGLIQTAGSAIEAQTEIVQRMREIALEASSSSLSSSERDELNTELEGLIAEFSRITSSTEFDGIKLLDGSFGSKEIQIGAGSSSSDRMTIQLDSLEASSTFLKTIGTGTFQTKTKVNSTGSTIGLDIGDLNNDGIADIASVTSDSVLAVQLGLGNGKFGVVRTFATDSLFGSANGVNQLKLGDVNNDGILDAVVAADFGGAIDILLGNGDGTFKSPITYSFAGAFSIALGDFNRDGNLDIVSSDLSSSTLLLGNGDGTFSVGTTPANAAPFNQAVGDVNGDGILDLLIGGTNITVNVGNGDGTFASSSFTLPSSGLASGMVLTDLNRDGKLDLVSTDFSNNYMDVNLGNGNGTFQAAITYSIAGSVSSVSPGDFNGDGVVDLIVGDMSGVGYIFQGNGNGTFKAAKTQAVGTDSWVLLAGDVTGDGVDDLVNADYSGAGVEVLTGNSTQTSAVRNIDVDTQADAQKLLSILDTTLESLLADRANLAAVSSRLDKVSAMNLLLNDNFETAKMNTVDVDFAMETADLVKNQILNQAQTAVLAQAQSLNRLLVTSLLKGLN